jgi:hypothetical protein
MSFYEDEIVAFPSKISLYSLQYIFPGCELVLADFLSFELFALACAFHRVSLNARVRDGITPDFRESARSFFVILITFLAVIIVNVTVPTLINRKHVLAE